MHDFIPTCVPEVKFRGQGCMCHYGQVCVSQDEKSLMEVFWFFFIILVGVLLCYGY